MPVAEAAPRAATAPPADVVVVRSADGVRDGWRPCVVAAATVVVGFVCSAAGSDAVCAFGPAAARACAVPVSSAAAVVAVLDAVCAPVSAAVLRADSFAHAVAKAASTAASTAADAVGAARLERVMAISGER